MATVEQRFWAKVLRPSLFECWVWTGTTNGRGYGRFGVEHHMVYPHRFSYELLVGPIPLKLTIDHLCRNRLCVNPSHLEVVTQQENILRGSGHAAINSQKSHCLRGHPLIGYNLIVPSVGKRKCRLCKNSNMNAMRRRHKVERCARSGSAGNGVVDPRA